MKSMRRIEGRAFVKKDNKFILEIINLIPVEMFNRYLKLRRGSC